MAADGASSNQRFRHDGCRAGPLLPRPHRPPQEGREVRRQDGAPRRIEAETAARIQSLPHLQFGVIHADPPWRFEPYSRETGMDRAADNHYACAAPPRSRRSTSARDRGRRLRAVPVGDRADAPRRCWRHGRVGLRLQDEHDLGQAASAAPATGCGIATSSCSSARAVRCPPRHRARSGIAAQRAARVAHSDEADRHRPHDRGLFPDAAEDRAVPTRPASHPAGRRGGRSPRRPNSLKPRFAGPCPRLPRRATPYHALPHPAGPSHAGPGLTAPAISIRA